MSITLSLLLHAFSLLPLNESTVEIADNDSKVVVVVVVVLLVPDDFISCTFLVMICQRYVCFFPYLCRNQSHLHEQGTTQNPSLINHHLMEKVHLKQQLYGSLLLMNQVQSVLSAWKTFRVSFFGNKERIFDATFITWWCICFAGKRERREISRMHFTISSLLLVFVHYIHQSSSLEPGKKTVKDRCPRFQSRFHSHHQMRRCSSWWWFCSISSFVYFCSRNR